MNAFWHEAPPASPEWFLICLVTSVLALPIIRFYCVNKQYFWKLYLGFFFLIFVGGFFFVLIIFLGIGSNIIKIFGVLPKEYFNLNQHASFWNIYLFSGFTLWYLLSLIYICKLGRDKE